jgi:hypothetical protein
MGLKCLPFILGKKARATGMTDGHTIWKAHLVECNQPTPKSKRIHKRDIDKIRVLKP